jgi:hypothetical protein
MAGMTMRKLWELSGDHHNMTRGFTWDNFVQAYMAILPPGVLGAALSGPLDGLGVRVIERYAHFAAIPGAAALMAYVTGIAGWTPVCVAADPLVIVSTAAADDNSPPGAGALRIGLDYIDDAGAAQYVEVETNGLANSVVNDPDGNPLLVPNPVGCFGINNMKVIESGTPPVPNVGDITLEDATNARIYEAIQAGMGKSQTCRYHVPVGRRCFIIRIAMAAEVSDVTYAMFSSTEDDMFAAVDQIIKRHTITVLAETAKWEHIFTEPLMVPPSEPNTYPSMWQLECVSANPAATGTASVFLVEADDTL